MATRMYVCESVEHPSSLLSGLNEQRLKGRLCDVTVKVQGNIFQAHINVLAAAMGYFRDLFSKPLKEKNDDMIEIPIIVNTTGFAKILDFVYTSQLCLSQSTVMQVLCSACYLQIPYVVEKCQEFIGTHGHVTSPSSISEVTGPLLQDLHRQNFPKVHDQSASASLSFLSQLNRLSNKSQMQLPPTKQSTSPSRGQESEEQQECELINTPPSPGGRSLTNAEERTTPDNSDSHSANKDPLKSTNMLSLKRERDVEILSGDDKQAVTVYSPQDRDRFTQTFNGLDAKKKFIYTSLNRFSQDRIIADSQAEIDHKSLADYFSTERDREQGPPTNHMGRGNPLIGYPFQMEANREGNADTVSKHQRIMTMAKTLQRERMLDSNQPQSFSLHPKKDKPKKEYGCDYCGKMFGRQQHLKRHILTHTGERPYPCQYCEKRFRRSEHLKHHLVSHEQALGPDGQLHRKRPRKTQQASDAYAMSKMMLDRYNGHMEIDGNGNMVENIASAPVVLPSMFTDAERKQLSPQAKITEIECGLTSRSDGAGKLDERNGHQVSPPYAAHSPMAALNLSRVSPKESDELRVEGQNIPSPAEHSPDDYNNIDRASEQAKPAECDQNFPRSGSLSPAMNGCNGVFDEHPASSDIIGMEGSEVLTTDLKRLIAAMDE